jgi:phytoene dehydrogenase-like protein
MALDQIFFMRPSRLGSTPIEIFTLRSGTHPGGGVTVCPAIRGKADTQKVLTGEIIRLLCYY